MNHVDAVIASDDRIFRELSVFLSELKDTAASALQRLILFEDITTEWMMIDAEIAGWPEEAQYTEDMFACMNRQWDKQSAMFEAVEDVLARYGRVSQILFPNGRGAAAQYAARRAERLRSALGLPKECTQILADRHLRDAWTHYDERLDEALDQQRLAWPQWFGISSELTDYHKANVPRLIVADTRELYYRDRCGAMRCTSLTEVKDAIITLLAVLKAYGSLRGSSMARDRQD